MLFAAAADCHYAATLPLNEGHAAGALTRRCYAALITPDYVLRHYYFGASALRAMPRSAAKECRSARSMREKRRWRDMQR